MNLILFYDIILLNKCDLESAPVERGRIREIIMEKKIERTSPEPQVSVEEAAGATVTFEGNGGRESAGSITVSVNAHRLPVPAEDPDDAEWLSSEEPEPEELTEDVPDEEDADEEEADEEGEEVEEIEEIADDDNSEDMVIYEVKEFEESGGEERRKINVRKVGCLSCSAVFALMIIVLVSFASGFYHFYRMMDIDEDDSIYFNDKVSFTDRELSEIPDGEVNIEDGEVFKDKSVFNILLIGTDERTKGFSKNARADSIMVLSFDSRTKRMKLVSLERGMLVSIPGRKNDILTHTFRYGGSNLLMQTVRSHFRLDVNKYVRVNFAMFQKLVDEVGGVDIELTEQEAYGLNKYPNHNTWKLKRKVYAGVNHFNGYEALQYARLRWIDDDFHRIERQRKVIIAVKENMKDLSVSDLKDVSADCLPYIQTNLTAVECADLLIRLPGYIENHVTQMTIPKKGTYQTLGHVDFAENARILHEFLYGNG